LSGATATHPNCHEAIEEVTARAAVHGGSDDEAYPVGDGVMAVSLRGLAQRLQRDAAQG